MNSKNKKIILIVIFVLLFVVFYNFLDSKVESFLSEEKIIFVDRVIDGDTIESNGTSIRFLGINTPERGEKYSSEAKQFLESLILSKEVRLEFVGEKQDKYYRTLAYVFLNSENVNVKMVENGFANYYFYSGKDKYSEELENSWEICLEKKINLCEKSKNICSSCISIEENYIINSCSFTCDVENWEIKGEGRNKIVFNKSLNPNEEISFNLDLSNSGGSLFLRDDEGKLVSWT